MNARKTVLAAVLAVCLSAPAVQAEDLRATVVKVNDGDTIRVRLVDCNCLPKIWKVVGVRFHGCDTPEKKDKRLEIAALARQASAYTASRLKPGQDILLKDVRRDKYGGRLVATVEVDGVDLCRELIDAGLAKPYFGGKKEW